MERIAWLSDPRYGYGHVASWNAKRWETRWPLDHIFHRGGFSVLSVERLDAFGSDHFPYVVHLCRAAEAVPQSPAPMNPDDKHSVEQAFADAGVTTAVP